MIKSVLLDMDGTVFDTEWLYARTLSQAGRKMGFDIDFEGEYLDIAGKSLEKIYAMVRERHGAHVPIERIFELRWSYVDEELEKNGYIDCPEHRMLRVSREYRDELSHNRLFDIFEKNDFCDYLMIHGTSDELASIEDARAFAERFDINMIEVNGADHRFKKEHDLEQLINYSMSFFLQ